MPVIRPRSACLSGCNDGMQPRSHRVHEQRLFAVTTLKACDGSPDWPSGPSHDITFVAGFFPALAFRRPLSRVEHASRVQRRVSDQSRNIISSIKVGKPETDKMSLSAKS